MEHAFAELRYGIVARQHENGFKYGHNFAHSPFTTGTRQISAHSVLKKVAGCEAVGDVWVTLLKTTNVEYLLFLKTDTPKGFFSAGRDGNRGSRDDFRTYTYVGYRDVRFSSPLYVYIL